MSIHRPVRRRAICLVTALFVYALAVMAGGPAAALPGTLEMSRSPEGPVAVGSAVEVQGAWVHDDPQGAGAQYVSIGVPAGLQLVDASVGGTSYPCSSPPGPSSGSCEIGPVPILVPSGTVFNFLFIALAPNDSATVGVRISTEFSDVSGSVTMPVVDPTIVSDVYPEFSVPPVGVVGEQATISGNVRNPGSQGHADVTAVIDVGDDVSVDSATWGAGATACSAVAGSVTCELGPMPSYTSVPVRVTFTPTAEDLDHPVTVTVTSTIPQDDPDPHPDTQEFVLDLVAAAVDIALTGGLNLFGDPVMIGVRFHAGFGITNKGPAVARLLTYEADVPANFTIEFVEVFYGSSNPDPWPGGTGCTVTGQHVSCNLGDVPAGEEPGVGLNLIPTDNTPGTITASARSSSPELDPDPSADDVSVEIPAPVDPYADWQNRREEPRATVVVGTPHVFEFQADQTGPASARNQQAVITVPDGWTIEQAEYNHGFGSPFACPITGSTATCSFGEEFTSGQPDIFVTATPSVVRHGDEITATWTSDLPDPDGPLTVTAVADVIATTITEVSPFFNPIFSPEVGRRFEVPVHVIVDGPAPAENVVLRVTLPESAPLATPDGVSWDAPFTGCTVADRVVTCTAPRLEPFSELNFVNRVVLDLMPTSVSPPFTIQATVTTTTPETVPDRKANTLWQSFGSGQFADVTGTVIAGVDLTGTRVLAYRTTDGLLPSVSTTVVPIGDGEGFFWFPIIPYGTYSFVFLPPAGSGLAVEWAGGATDRADALRLTLTERYNRVPDEVLPRAGSISGVITDGAGNPLSGVEVSGFLPGDRWLGRAVATTGADGSYVLEGLHPGSYRILARAPAGSGRTSGWYDGTPSPVDATPVSVAEGASESGIDIALPPAGTVSGTVSGPGGAPVGDVRVIAFRTTDTWLGSAQVRTASDGTFSLQVPVPGTYKIRFVPPAGSGLAATWYRSPGRPGSPPFTLSAGQVVTGIDQTLSSA